MNNKLIFFNGMCYLNVNEPEYFSNIQEFDNINNFKDGDVLFVVTNEKNIDHFELYDENVNYYEKYDCNAYTTTVNHTLYTR